MNPTITSNEAKQLAVIEEVVNTHLRVSRNGSSTSNRNTITNVMYRVIPNALLPSKKIDITWNDNAKQPFIMSITPDIEELYKKTEDLTKILNDPKGRDVEYVRKWAEIKHWHIEIDSRIVTKGHRLCVDDGREFVAILCHEVGHVFTESPLRLIYNYKQKMIQFKLMERLMLSNKKSIRAIMLPMFTHALQFKIVVMGRNDDLNCEKAADRFIPDEYKGALVSYLDNHILNNPDTANIVISDTDYDHEVSTGVELSKESIYMLKDRRDALERQIQTQYNSPQSGKFHKKLMKFIGKKLTGYDPEDDTYITGTIKSTLENAYLRDYNSACMEATAILEATRVGTRELDILEIQIEDIQTPEDKMYMIHKVYDYMEVVLSEQKKQAKTKSKKSKDIEKVLKVTDTRMDRLNDIRSRIMKKEVHDSGDKYGLYVKYPAGYEG